MPNTLDIPGYALLRETCGLLELNSFGLITMSGEDRKGWLQGQITADLRSLQSFGYRSFCQCSPTGQLQAMGHLWDLAGRFVIASEAPGTILDRVQKMVILEDVKAELTQGALLAVQGPDATRKLGKLIDLPTLDAMETELDGELLWLFRADLTGLGGWLLFFPAGKEKALSNLRRTFEPISAEAYEIASLEAGIPLFGRDTDSKTLPPELGKFFEDKNISYSKGCYVGQEVLMRIHSRGHTNRTWVALVSERSLEAGARVSHPKREDAGTITRAAYSPTFGHIAGAMLRNEAAQEGDIVAVQTVTGPVQAEVREMPLLRLV